MSHSTTLLRGVAALLFLGAFVGCQSRMELGPPRSDWRKVAAADVIVAATLVEAPGALQVDEKRWRVVELHNATSLKGPPNRYALLDRDEHPDPLDPQQRYLIYIELSDRGNSYIDRMDRLPDQSSGMIEAVRHDIHQQRAWVDTYGERAHVDDWVVHQVRRVVDRLRADRNASAALAELILMGPLAIPAICHVMWEVRDAAPFDERVSVSIPGGPWGWEAILHYSLTHPVDVLSLALFEIGGEAFGMRVMDGAPLAIRQNVIDAWLVYGSYFQREASTDRWNLVRRPRLLSEGERRDYVAMTHGFSGALERFDIAAHPELVAKLDEMKKKYLSGFFPARTESELSDGDKSRLGYQREALLREYVLELVMQGRVNIDR